MLIFPASLGPRPRRCIRKASPVSTTPRRLPWRIASPRRVAASSPLRSTARHARRSPSPGNTRERWNCVDATVRSDRVAPAACAKRSVRAPHTRRRRVAAFFNRCSCRVFFDLARHGIDNQARSLASRPAFLRCLRAAMSGRRSSSKSYPQVRAAFAGQTSGIVGVSGAGTQLVLGLGDDPGRASTHPAGGSLAHPFHAAFYSIAQQTTPGEGGAIRAGQITARSAWSSR